MRTLVFLSNCYVFQGPISQVMAEHYLLMGSREQLFSPFASAEHLQSCVQSSYTEDDKKLCLKIKKRGLKGVYRYFKCL